MCGIAGFAAKGNARVDGKLARRVLKDLHHRGPDGAGYLSWTNGRAEIGRDWPEGRPIEGVVLLHRRLSILDLEETGAQPMPSQDGKYFVSFNGEIYNYIELKKELEQLGHRFVSTSDTEVLLTSYIQWGPECFSRFTGMFACAILDCEKEKLTLARDCFGIKPLYFAETDSLFAFGSEMRTLLATPGVGRTVQSQMLFDYLRFGLTDHGERTLFDRIFQVPAAHYLEISTRDPSRRELKTYWRVSIEDKSSLSFGDASEQLRSIFVESVKQHLRSDVPVAATLSGGIDSSSIVLAAKAALGPNADLPIFSYVADDAGISEEKWIDIVARHGSLEVRKIRPAKRDLAQDLRRLIAVQETPFGSTSIYAQYRIFEAIHADGVKVVLDGQGADEILAGYRPYIGARVVSLLRGGNVVRAARLLLQASRLPGFDLRTGLAYVADQGIPSRFQETLRKLVGRELMPNWLNEKWFSAKSTTKGSLHYNSSRSALKHDLRRALTETGLPHLLRYEDRNSMAFSVESRVPFLNPRLVEFCYSLPESYLISDTGESKTIFRRAMRGLVPDAILDRSDKIGFKTPEHSWLMDMGEWIDELTGSNSYLNRIPALNPDEVRNQWRRIRDEGRSFDSRLWRWINLLEWSHAFHVEYEA